MLNPKFRKHLEPIFDQMQEIAFENPILKSGQMGEAILTGKFNQIISISNLQFLSVCVTVSPTDDDKTHFWAASVSFVLKHSGKPKTCFLWTAREKAVAEEVLKLALKEVGLDAEKGTIKLFTKKVAMHAHKDLSAFERETIQEMRQV